MPWSNLCKFIPTNIHEKELEREYNKIRDYPNGENLDEINYSKELEKVLNEIERNNKLMYDACDLLQDILLEIKALRKSVQNSNN